MDLFKRKKADKKKSAIQGQKKPAQPIWLMIAMMGIC